MFIIIYNFLLKTCHFLIRHAWSDALRDPGLPFVTYSWLCRHVNPMPPPSLPLILYLIHLTTMYTIAYLTLYAMLAYAIVYLAQAKEGKNSCYTATEAPFRCRGALLNGVRLESASYLLIQGSLVVFSSVSVSERSVSYQNTFKMGYKKTTKRGFSGWKCSLALYQGRYELATFPRTAQRAIGGHSVPFVRFWRPKTRSYTEFFMSGHFWPSF